MLYFSRFKVFAILAAVVLGILFAAPNFMSEKGRESLPDVLNRTVNLGLDLRGGAYLSLEVDLDSVVDLELERVEDSVGPALREANRIRLGSGPDVDGETIVGRFRSPEDYDAGFEALRGLIDPVEVGAFGQTADSLEITDEGDGRFRISITEERIEEIKTRTIEQSIEVLRRRVDPNGVLELTIRRQGEERILLLVPGVGEEEIAVIKERIDKSANLAFRLVDNRTNDAGILGAALNSFSQLEPDEDGRYALGDVRTPAGTRFYPGAQNEGGGGYIVERRTNITGDCLKSSTPGLHPQRPNEAVVNFRFDTRCSIAFSNMTRNNIGTPFAVVLDDLVISAPNIRSHIPGGSGYIEGGFTLESARELSTLLNAGALPAKLVVVEERSIDPTLGQDSIDAGRIASMIGMALVAGFMWLSYGLRFGTIANLALATNIILIAGALTFLGSTLTLPGIAGIILTIGMAVDANVLIFERIREEADNGRPVISAIETGYKRSFAPILDANITTLIAAVTLYFVGSGPVRGFAVTLAVGIVMSVFTAVIFARLLTATWLRRTRPTSLPI